jgi:hypothetical protein
MFSIQYELAAFSHHSRRAQVKQLDDGIGDTFVSVVTAGVP